ncbi:Pumilio like protein 2 [Nosema granulosis]|uniref:Pumilio like protein 2 n=1 Tax=Nosema granulosis TaxID=83296 RepID=A0A9P6KZ44_9MICR|nr:Pumilio like protein 2 [Nosema granulosis]
MKNNNSKHSFDLTLSPAESSIGCMKDAESRPCSAPPVDKLFLSDDVELIDIQGYLQYSSYYRRNSKHDVRLPPPEFYIRGQNSIWLSEYDDFITKAFSTDIYGIRDNFSKAQASLLDKIDNDFPESESSTFKGPSRATTPIGDHMILDTDTFNSILKISKEPSTVKKGAYAEMKSENTFLRDVFIFCSDQSKAECPTSNYIKDFCVFMSKDQEGSRLIQNKIEVATEEELAWFFDQIEESLFDLSTNLFGNYVVQKIIPQLSHPQKECVLEEFSDKIYGLSIHPYGCRVIQKIMESIECIDYIKKEIKDHVFGLIEDQNGNHVIQKYIEKSKDKSLIIQAFEKNSVYLSTHRYGCRVIQRLLEFCEQQDVKRILSILISNLESLVNDQYGNYVIQHMLTVSDKDEKDRVVKKIINDCYELSKYKFSSNVIEQCVLVSTKPQKEGFLSKFLEMDGDRPRIYNMSIDMYGNYVVQRFFDSCDSEMKARIKKVLKPYLKDLKKVNFARHILFKINT